MRTFVMSDLLKEFKNERHVAYCYEGSHKGSIALFHNNCIIAISPSGYILHDLDELIGDNSRFELWGFIHEMMDKEYFAIREEALSRLFEAYSSLYTYMCRYLNISEEFPFITESI